MDQQRRKRSQSTKDEERHTDMAHRRSLDDSDVRPSSTSSASSHHPRSASGDRISTTMSSMHSRRERFLALLAQPNVSMGKLRSLAWSGIPADVRATAWKILLGYLPTNRDRRPETLERKRREYYEFLKQSFVDATRDDYEEKTFRQICIDVPRTIPSCDLFQVPVIQRSLERILYLWALRHPASGYVQGINDLVTPFFVLFLKEQMGALITFHLECLLFEFFCCCCLVVCFSPLYGVWLSFLALLLTLLLHHLLEHEGDVDDIDVSSVTSDTFQIVEADSFWCMTKLLDSVQDNYTFAQPGIQKMVFKLQELVSRIDAPLSKHLEDEGIQFIEFAFRWMNCLLMRELSLNHVIRMWDTYLAEGEGFATLHVYVCAALLIQWSSQIRQLDFQGIMLFLQRLPTATWAEKEVEMLLSQAFLYKTLYQDSPSHLRSSES
eukprot:TRINITY_DN1898_c0_g1_i1.p1 TRINITY_DN1898_c0_g1~~TRINITY_DN1898_c0_g1_i1.p1  ORF type:complete len:499 (+),score=135.51 TRINITY_DN1898_c0_g1_i1:189-1499(+)